MEENNLKISLALYIRLEFNVFCTSQYYKYIYARLTSSFGSVSSFQCSSYHHGSTKEPKVLPLYRLERLFGVINLSLDEIFD